MSKSSLRASGEFTGADLHRDMKPLFELYYPRLCYLAYSMIGDWDAGRDLVQDAFLALWRRTRDADPVASAEDYLFISVRNACLNRRRHEKVKQKFIESQDLREEEAEQGANNLIRAEVYGEIHKSIEALPPGCRQVLNLAYFEGLKNDEIAKQLGVSVNTVKTQKARALQLLRLKLDAGAFLLLLALLGLDCSSFSPLLEGKVSFIY